MISPQGREPGREPGDLTTPDPVALHRTLADLAARGIDHLALEASSHGLDQHRLDGVRIAAAAFTNLSRDHLDYHGTMSAYREAKVRLFRDLLRADGTAVLNADDATFPLLREACQGSARRLLTYGSGDTDVRLERLVPTVEGLDLAFTYAGRRYELEVPLIGEFQATNLLCAFALVVGCGGSAEAAADALATVVAVPGRMQRVAQRPDGAAVYVDYAHTPDALAHTLRALRPLARGRLLVVFGCGGDRDPGKRPRMGAIAKRLADLVFVTDDNPRSEPAAEIRRAILTSCAGCREIGERDQAIVAAISELRAGDVLVIAGKGDEQGQIVGRRVIPGADAETAKRAVAELWGSNETKGRVK